MIKFITSDHHNPTQLLEDLLNVICQRHYCSSMTEFQQFFDAIFHNEHSLSLPYLCDTDFFRRYFENAQSLQQKCFCDPY